MGGQPVKKILVNARGLSNQEVEARAIYWKQWKKVKTRRRMIQKYGMPKWKVHEIANCRKGIWRSALMLNSVLTKQEIASLGYISMTGYYLKVCEN